MIHTFVLTRIGIIGLHNLSRLLSNSFDDLKIKKYKLTTGDILCLIFNSFIETCFMLWLVNYTIVTVSIFFPFNFILLFILDDILYAPYHHILHIKPFFSYIHFRHHKITNPSKHYIHASMEHPIEMIGALLLHSFMIYTMHSVLDKISVLMHILIKAIGACLNHSGKDVQFLLYKSSHHHLHHMYRKCNYSQYIFIYDKLIGTYTK